MPKSNPHLLSPGDVALILRKSTATINRWGEMGLLGEVTMTAGGQRRYGREAVEALLRSQAAELQAEVQRLEAAAS
jgi:DNA-binding transcriptional MerR regulator